MTPKRHTPHIIRYIYPKPSLNLKSPVCIDMLTFGSTLEPVWNEGASISPKGLRFCLPTGPERHAPARWPPLQQGGWRGNPSWQVGGNITLQHGLYKGPPLGPASYSAGQESSSILRNLATLPIRYSCHCWCEICEEFGEVLEKFWRDLWRLPVHLVL